MKPSRSKQRRRRRANPEKPRKASPLAKLNTLPDDQVAQIVAWLFQGKTYAGIRALVKRKFRVTCSLMAVKTMWDKYAAAEERMRTERIIRQARLLQSAQTNNPRYP
jgi:hypothetical protein